MVLYWFVHDFYKGNTTNSNNPLKAFDTLLTLGNEVEHIWSSKINIVMLLYFLSRYTAFVDVALILFCKLAGERHLLIMDR